METKIIKSNENEAYRLLELSDFSESNSSGLISVRFLDSSGDGSTFSRSFIAELFSGSFGSSVLSRGLFRSSHLLNLKDKGLFILIETRRRRTSQSFSNIWIYNLSHY
jgi:hypothetical protein